MIQSQNLEVKNAKGSDPAVRPLQQDTADNISSRSLLHRDCPCQRQAWGSRLLQDPLKLIQVGQEHPALVSQNQE